MGLIAAIKNNNLESARKSLQSPDAESANQELENGDTPLILAVQHNNMGMVKLLFDYNARETINTSNCIGETPLYWTAFNDNPEMLEYLLSNGAQKSSCTSDNEGKTPLYWAAAHDNTEISQRLLNSGAKESVNETAQDDCSPIWWAVFHGNSTMTQLFLNNGARVAAQVLKMAKGDTKALLERRLKALVEINACLLSMNRKMNMGAPSIDNVPYDSLVFRQGRIPKLIFSHLRKLEASDETKKGLYEDSLSQEKSSDEPPQPDTQQHRKPRHGM